MRRLLLGVVLGALCASAVPTPAQMTEPELPEYTDQQRWERLAYLAVSWQAATISMGKELGMTPAEVGAWLGDYYQDGWLGGMEAGQFLVSTYRNHMSMPGAEGEVISSTPTSVTARFNRPADPYIGADGVIGGVTAEEIDEMFAALNESIAQWVGVRLEREAMEDGDVFTMETEYGPIQASNALRWGRGAYLSWLAQLQLISLRKADGMTAREIGEADAELYGSTWTATTPWRLFRGMAWNQMSDPTFRCEVLSAGPDEVRGRCPLNRAGMIEANQERFGVSVEDVFESRRAFAEGVAEQLGMRWTETLENGQRMITVTRR